MKRILLGFILAFTLPLVATASVASIAMAGDMLCEQRMSLTSASNADAIGHDAHGAARMSHAGHAIPDPDTDPAKASAPLCCDHACVAELPVLTMDLTQGQVTSPVPRSWTVAGLTELTGPTGLRRPPKA